MVDHHGEVAVALLVADLIDADPGQAPKAVHALPGLSGHPRGDPTNRPPGHPQQLSHCRLGGVHHQPGHGVLKGLGGPGAVPRPGQRRDHHPMPRAPHPGGVGLQVRPDHTKVQRPPAPAALALVVAGTPPPTAPATAPVPARRPDAGHDRVGLFVEQDVLDDGVLDAEQPCPYPLGSHAVPPPGNPALSSRKPSRGTACSHARAARGAHGSVRRASFAGA